MDRRKKSSVWITTVRCALLLSRARRRSGEDRAASSGKPGTSAARVCDFYAKRNALGGRGTTRDSAPFIGLVSTRKTFYDARRPSRFLETRAHALYGRTRSVGRAVMADDARRSKKHVRRQYANES